MQKKSLPTEIHSQRIILKKLDLSSAPLVFDYVEKDRERLRQFLPWVDSTKTVEDEAQFIQMTHEKWDLFEFFNFGIFRKEDNQFMGVIGAHTISWTSERCELGYWILGSFEKNGYMTEAVLAVERELFNIGFNRIEIRCSSKNERSAQVPRNCGYTLEGQLREDTFELGAKRNTFIFGKLKREL